LDPARAVPSDVDDFVAFVATLAENYFARPNYVTVGGRSYLSIFDSTFFVRELGPDGARAAIAAARRWLRDHGHRDLHLAAIEPNAATLPLVRDVGFDSVTHYVLLPDWKGPFEQDYREYAERRAGEWASFGERSGLPYMPSVAPGWDASPRGADFGDRRPDKYPWSPVVTGEHPALFADALRRARAFRSPRTVDDPLVMIASLNEWSEGHYLEPDERFGYGWLEAVRAR
ncbi:MAG: glycoside hydrolase family 99-like domain-containing protein, partial [Planctomycetes bacterium]|nr:glycoside hydrolase family 99-like domain-containing protein [Planctomycetota bacterium]